MVNIDNNFPEEEQSLISLPCMRSIIKLAGVTFKQRKKILKLENKVSLLVHFDLNNNYMKGKLIGKLELQ